MMKDAAAALKYALTQLGRSRSKQFTAEKMLVRCECGEAQSGA